MKAKDGKTYAIINDGKVTKIFDKNEIEEWNEETLFVVEVKPEDYGWLQIDDKYDYEKKRFIPPTLEEAKYQQEYYINNRFDNELSEFKSSFISPDELDTYQMQADEAKKYMESGNPEDAHYLSILAEQRGESLDDLVLKVIEKNKAYNEKLFTLMGYKQKLMKQLESAQDLEEVAKIEYISPYGFK